MLQWLQLVEKAAVIKFFNMINSCDLVPYQI